MRLSLDIHSTRFKKEWKSVLEFVRVEIEREWYRKNDPGFNFITRDKLNKIWGTVPPRMTESSFNILRKCFSPKLGVKVFQEKFILLASALVHVRWEWEKLFARHPNYKLDDDGFGVRISSNPTQWNTYADKDLPLQDDVIHQLIGGHSERFRDFKDIQYAVNPLKIIMRDGRSPIECPSGTRLPFASEKDRGREGYYGQVFETEVVQGYLTFSDGHSYSQGSQTKNVPTKVACKKLPMEKDFNKEVENLEILQNNHCRHDHIMTHLAAIIMEDRWRILFPWAWTDLNAFFQMRPADYPTWLQLEKITPYNVLNQVQFLGRALEFLHENIIDDGSHAPLCHMDLKPENIVLTEVDGSEHESNKYPLGRWKITDFGIAAPITPGIRTMGQVVKSISSQPPVYLHEIGDFQAPEAERNRKDQTQDVDHSKADIWSFGCVFVEAIAFSIRGSGGITEMRSRRKRASNDADGVNRSGHFYRAMADGQYQLLPEIHSYFHDLASSGEFQRGWIHDIWSLIKNQALVICPENRDSARNLCEKLNAKIQTVPRVYLPKTPLPPRPEMELLKGTSSTSSQPIAPSDVGDFKSELSKRELKKPKFVIVAPDCDHLVWSDRQRVLCFSRPFSDKPEHFREYRGPSHSSIERQSVQIAGSILAFKEGYKEISIQTIDSNVSLPVPDCAPLFQRNGAMKFGFSSTHSIFLECARTIQVFDNRNANLLSHSKERSDLILDIKFDRSGNYLMAVSREKYFVWQLNGSHESKLIRDRHHSVKRGKFRPGIVPFNDLPDFMIHDFDFLKEIIVVDCEGPKQYSLARVEGDIVDAAIVTPCNTELVIVALAKNHNLCLYRWSIRHSEGVTLQVIPESFQFTSQMRPHSISGGIVVGTFREQDQNFVLIVERTGLFHRVPLGFGHPP